jgi:short-subunit dehydrogenase
MMAEHRHDASRGSALITGGDRGIGYALSKRLAADGWQLLWVGHTPTHLQDGNARLMTETNCEAQVLVCDLSEADAAVRVHDWACGLGAEPDLLVNNAGFGAFGLLTELPLERDLAMLRLNNATVHRLTRLFLDGMQRTSIFRDWLATTPDVVARDIHRALHSGRRVVVSGRAMRWVLPLAEVLPRWLQDRYLLARYRRELSAATRNRD